MKIAIMTQPLGKNYGGMMQAYALQKVLRDLGHDVTTIDYNVPEPNLLYKTARLSSRLLRKLTGKLKVPINLEANLDYVLENTQQFIKQNILLSKYIDNSSALKEHFDENSYDIVIVGSDQTWRPLYSPNIYNFYLDFLKQNKNIKKIAYASSFGVDNWEYTNEQAEKCAELATLFYSISVREESGIELCKKHLGVNSECVLDPTLLLNKNDYMGLVGKQFDGKANKGVFTYFLDVTAEKVRAAEHVAKILGKPTYQCQSRNSLDKNNAYELDDYIMPKVEEWLGSFMNADFVLTDSFHGVVFSIIFEKPFYVIINKQRGAARFYSLLSKLGKLDRLIEDPNQIMSSVDDLPTIEYNKDDLLDKLRKHSKTFLIDSIEK